MATDILPDTSLLEASAPASPVGVTNPLAIVGSPRADLVMSGKTSPNRNDQVRVWIADGILGTKYTLEVRTEDDTTPHPRRYVRSVTIKIKEQ